MNAPRRPRTILFLIADTGAGHRSAANAITAAMCSLTADEPPARRAPARGERAACWQAIVVDAFADCCRFPLRNAVFLYGPIIQHSPRVYGQLYHLTNTPPRFDMALRLCQPFLRQGLRRLIEQTRPDVIVSIHPLLNHITLQVLHDLRLRIPVVTVVTDLVTIHCSWMAPGVDACVVPTEAARARALAAGIPGKRIHLLGMPIHPAFARTEHRSREELKLALGLDPALPTILMVGGGEGAGRLAAAVKEVYAAKLPAQLVVIVGRNSHLRAELEGIRDQPRSGVHVHVFDFVENMPDFMRAADILVTKAGPGTICEAIACELPILLTGAVPGQEEGNIDYVRDNGLGEVIETPEELVGVLRALLKPGNSRLAALRQAEGQAGQAGQPRASFDIARLILSYLPGAAAPSFWTSRRVRPHLARRYVWRAGRMVSRMPSRMPLSRLGTVPAWRIRHMGHAGRTGQARHTERSRGIDGMRRALPSSVRERRHVARLTQRRALRLAQVAQVARVQALLKRDGHETI